MPQPDGLPRIWPAAGLRVRAGDLELRWIDDELLVELADVAARGVHPPDTMPFEHPWTRGAPEDVVRSVVRYQWDARSQVSPDRFVLELGVVLSGVPVGVQGLVADDWSVLRRVQTGSWLGLSHHGRGIGSRMRALILHFAFGALGALEATSGAFADNAASNAVSRRLGYESDGTFRVARDHIAVPHNRYVMSRSGWESLRERHAALIGAPVEIQGLEQFRRQIERGTAG